jgi:CDP-glycerol glycerophosphotransferase (TagB/SpsB family)
VASFSFGAGNAQKLLSIPLYAVGRFATVVIPRTRDEWVFGCAVGLADGALALWQEATANGERAMWLTGDDRQARDAAARGIPHAPVRSVQGFWRTARARVVVVTHGFGDVNRYAVSGAVVVQLWHGIPLKRIGLDSAETVRSGILPGSRAVRGLLRRMYAGATRRIRVLPAASHLVRARLESAFALPDERVPVTGEPRVDVLSRGTAEARRAEARAAVAAAAGPFADGSSLVLYAPTWRDGAVDPAVPTDAEWRDIVTLLERRDAYLLVRSHPLGAGEYRPPFATDRVRDLGSGVVADVTPLLPGLDALVTDYSSLAFDAGLVPLPVVYFAPDLDVYRARRGMYGRYSDVAADGWADDWPGVLGRLDETLDDPAPARARSFALSERMHAFRDGGNTRRVYRAIRDALDEGRGTP